MKTRKITLKYKGTCRTCGAKLAAGTVAKWAGRGQVFCLECEETSTTEIRDKNGYIGWVSEGADGREYYQNYRGRCEDAPCCGCCNC